MNVMARSAHDDPAALTAGLREAVRAIDPTLPLYAIRTMDEGPPADAGAVALQYGLMSLLGLTGLILAALGSTA